MAVSLFVTDVYAYEIRLINEFDSNCIRDPHAMEHLFKKIKVTILHKTSIFSHTVSYSDYQIDVFLTQENCI